jgi:hypothetical protein
VVVDKPPGMLSFPAEPGDKGTLGDHVRTLLRAMGRGDTALSVVHRLDRETSGLVVFARTAQAKRVLAAQFRAHDIDRVYHAIALGMVSQTRVETIECLTHNLRRLVLVLEDPPELAFNPGQYVDITTALPHTVLDIKQPLTIEAVSPNVPVAHKELAPASMMVTGKH